MSYLKETPLNIAKIEKTIEAAPLRPAALTTKSCLKLVLKKIRMLLMANGRAMNVKKRTKINDGKSTSGNSLGVTKRPKRKKIITWAMSLNELKK